jgi:glycerol-3-phosphate acyltransferase PlsY
VLRSAGKLAGFLTLAADTLKGAAAVLLAVHFDLGSFSTGMAGLFSVLGHNFSIFLKFKGGKGVATSLGVLAVYTPFVALLTAVVWLTAVLLTRYSSLGAIVSFLAMPLGMAFFESKEKLPIALSLSVILLIRHRGNISRLLNGTEMRIGKRT